MATLNGFETRAMRAFRKFDQENPEFYPLLVKFAREAKRAGKRVYSITPIIQRARWAYDIETTRTGDKAFKINDHVAPYYSRMMMMREPDLRTFFNTRDTNGGEPDLWAARIRVGTITAWWSR